MTNASPDTAVATLLADAGVGTRGADIWEGPTLPSGAGIPHEAIFVLASGGPGPTGYCDGRAGRHDMRPRVQVTIRSSKKSYSAGKAKADAVHAALVAAAYGTPPTGYIDLSVVEGGPTYLGLDGSDMHRWSVNVQLWRHYPPETT